MRRRDWSSDPPTHSAIIKLFDRHPRYQLWISNPRFGNLDDPTSDNFANRIATIDQVEAAKRPAVGPIQFTDFICWR